MKTMTINELKEICINDSIPILRDKTLEYIINIIKENKIKSILEIGTAYGYSSFAFNQIDCVNEILSIEKNKDNYLKAKNFLAGNKKINLVNDDCFDFVPNKKYDLIFIDGPKSHQDQLFLKYSNYLEDNGFIIIDNIFLKKYSSIDFNSLTKNQQHLVKKVKEFQKWLENNNEWNINILDIDDGVAICHKK
ncbi:MAG: class I SAM-dependent methyltransferase [Mycoplasmataceae bacterium]|nr:class I SAM-dependent methyltransferase [Mycoplasmataceae bacterium]